MSWVYQPVLPAAAQLLAGGATPQELAGAVDAVSTVSGAILVEKPLAGAVAGVSTASGVLLVLDGFEIERKTGAGAFERIYTNLDSAERDFIDTGPFDVGETYTYRVRLVVADVPGDWSNEDAVLFAAGAVELAGSVAAISGVAAALTVGKPLAGSAAATSTVAGAASVGKLLGGSCAGQSTVAGAVLKPAALAGSVPVLATISGTLSPAVAVHLAGIIAAQAQVAGAMEVGKPLAGSVPAAAILAGDLLCEKLLAGSMPALSGLAGAAQQDIHLAGLAAAEALIVGDLEVGAAAELAGIVAAASGLTGSLWVAHFLAGQVSGQATLAGALVETQFSVRPPGPAFPRTPRPKIGPKYNLPRNLIPGTASSQDQRIAQLAEAIEALKTAGYNSMDREAAWNKINKALEMARKGH